MNRIGWLLRHFFFGLLKVIKIMLFPRISIFYHSLSLALVTVIKIIAFILIASIVVELTLAAPMTKDSSSSSSTDKPKNQQQKNNLNRRRQTGLKHLKNGDRPKIPRQQRKLFKNIHSDLWNNACNQNSIAAAASNNDNSNNVNTVEPYRNSMLTELNVAKSKLQNLQAINISQRESWEEFHNETFTFLETHPKVS